MDANQQQVITCGFCNQAVYQSYYDFDGKTLCAHCHEKIDQNSSGRLLKALAAGFGAAILGAILWWAVRYYLEREMAIISIAIGFGVGSAVKWASGGRGGRGYQVLAVLLTYTAVAFNYTPDVIQMFQDKAKEEKPAAANGAKKDEPLTAGDAALGVLAIFAIAAAAPFLGGARSLLGLLIILFGLFEAWKIAGKNEAAITGPYSVTGTT